MEEDSADILGLSSTTLRSSAAKAADIDRKSALRKRRGQFGPKFQVEVEAVSYQPFFLSENEMKGPFTQYKNFDISFFRFDAIYFSHGQDRPTYTVPKKFGTMFVRLNFTLTDFLNYFAVRIRRKFVIILSLKIPSHLKCVAILPCEVS